MKKLILSLLFVSVSLISFEASAILKIKISISSRAYWDGTKCEPRERGGCIHIDGDLGMSGDFGGTLENSNEKLTITMEKNIDISATAFDTYFRDGSFSIGVLTVDKRILNHIGYTGSNSFSSNSYPYIVRGNSVIVYLN